MMLNPKVCSKEVSLNPKAAKIVKRYRTKSQRRY
jgi:hypothetical protein